MPVPLGAGAVGVVGAVGAGGAVVPHLLSAAHVWGPAFPFLDPRQSCAAFWNAFSAASVIGPNFPSNPFGSKPAAARAFCNFSTSGPLLPRWSIPFEGVERYLAESPGRGW